MYEFEALLFSDNEKMAAGLGTQKDWIDAVLSEFYDIEKINNSKETAPSKRIGKHAQGRREKFWGISCEKNHDFTPKNLIFFQF